MPHHSGWVAAFVTTLLLTAVGAATEGQELSAAAVQARATISAALGGAEATVEADASASVATPEPTLAVPELPSRPAPERPPPPPANETNETEPAPAEPAPANETPATPDAPATLAPHDQDVHGQAGAPIRFVILLTNTADVAQDVALTAKAPVGWDVRISPDRAILGADETVAIRGTVVAPRMVGAAGTIAIRAVGAGGEDVAFVDVCSIGEPDRQCERPPDALNVSAPERSEPAPASNATDPANETQPAPEPQADAAPQPEPAPANETAEPTPEPAPRSTKPSSSNSTGNSTGNATASGSGAGSGSASAEASVTFEASMARDEDREESPPPVTLEV